MDFITESIWKIKQYSYFLIDTYSKTNISDIITIYQLSYQRNTGLQILEAFF
jgi:hypothetical protein